MKIKHPGLRRFYEHDDGMRLNPAHLRRVRRILTDLDVAQSPRNMDSPGYRLHPLKGNRSGWWSVRVSGNWRILFRFEGTEAVDVDLIDYH